MDLLGADFADISAFIKQTISLHMSLTILIRENIHRLKTIYTLALRAFTAHRVENIYDLRFFSKIICFRAGQRYEKMPMRLKTRLHFIRN